MSGARLAPEDILCLMCDQGIRAQVDWVVEIEGRWAHEKCVEDEDAIAAAAAGAAASAVIFWS